MHHIAQGSRIVHGDAEPLNGTRSYHPKNHEAVRRPFGCPCYDSGRMRSGYTAIDGTSPVLDPRYGISKWNVHGRLDGGKQLEKGRKRRSHRPPAR